MRNVRARHDERGQAAVEFTLMTVALFFSTFLVVQLTWIAIQKWQFNHFASYAARVWAVHKDQSPGDALFRVIVPGGAYRWDFWSKDYVKLMWVSSEEPRPAEDGSGSISGITYTGVAPLFPIYQPAIGDTFTQAFIPSWVYTYLPFEMPSTGLIAFETFIPMEKEPDEEPDRSDRDNDCEGTPCEGGNGR
jgi:hypothetical protein